MLPVFSRPVSFPRSELATTLIDVKASLRIDSGDTSEDATISGWIRAASRALAGSMGLDFAYWRQRMVERLPASGGLVLQFHRHPIEQVHSLSLGGTAVDLATVATYRGHRSAENGVLREEGWPISDRVTTRSAFAGARALDVEVDYTAGWLMPDDVATWSASAVKTLGAWVRPSTTTGLLYEVTTAGTTGATEPTWPVSGATVVSGTVTFTARDAMELPLDVQLAATLTAKAYYRGDLEIPMAVFSETSGSSSMVFARGGDEVIALPPAARALLEGYR